MTWHEAAMASDAVAIPKLCPNCMRPASHSWRYPLVRGNQRTWGTFLYCDECNAMMKRAGTTTRLVVWCSLLLFVPGAAALAFALKLSGTPLIAELVAVPIVLAIAVWALRRKPVAANAVTRGYAAFYAGKQRTGIGMKMRDEFRFTALRDEWLEALVDLNPTLTDPDEYLRRKGRDKPSGLVQPNAQ